jgi:hypothetical protein
MIHQGVYHMKCLKCNDVIPRTIWVDGKQRNLQRRKYCLSCSPFGNRNTKQLHVNPKRICLSCNRPMNQVKGNKCWACASRKSRERHADRLYEMMGDECWHCGYDKCRAAMDYHHIDSSQKKFELTMREMQMAWPKILEEARKCVLLCCRCHREFHKELISEDRMNSLYEDRWKQIDQGRMHNGRAPFS